MPFVTTLTFKSGDRELLDEVVGGIKEDGARKGVELKGPHPEPPTELRVPQYRGLDPDGDRFDAWSYTVYTRTIAVIGHDQFARSVAGREFPRPIHVEVEVEQRSQAGGGAV